MRTRVEIYEYWPTDPQAPFVSLRRASQTVTASLKSPSIVANSANRLCWDEKPGDDPLVDGVGVLAVGEVEFDNAGEDCALNRRRVEENNREGSRREDEYCDKSGYVNLGADLDRPTYQFVPIQNTFLHPRY